jgi:hypothetical protein
MADRVHTIVIGVSAVVVAGALVYAANTLRRSEPAASSTAEVTTPSSAVPAVETARAAPTPAAAGLTSQGFVQAWKDQGFAKRAEEECWSKAGAGVPTSFVAFLAVSPTGANQIEPERISRRVVPGDLARFNDCIVRLMKSVQLPPIPAGTRLRVQVDRN